MSDQKPGNPVAGLINTTVDEAEQLATRLDASMSIYTDRPYAAVSRELLTRVGFSLRAMSAMIRDFHEKSGPAIEKLTRYFEENQHVIAAASKELDKED